MKVSLVFIMFFFTSALIQAQSFQMMEIPGGTTLLGATEEQEAEAYPKEFPAHEVEIPAFYLGVYEVTQSEWLALMGDNPSLNKHLELNYPVDYIDWMSAIIFCNEASISDPGMGLSQCVYYKDAAFSQPYGKLDYSGDGNSELNQVFIDYSKAGYRLPTEAEWEFAARGGQSDQMTKFAGSNDMDFVGYYSDNSGWESFPVGAKAANELGLYDMSGNVWEMVNDWYGPYGSLPSVHPKGPSNGSHKVLKGGAYDYADVMCRVSVRYMVLPDDKDSDIGLRIARNK